MLPNCQQRLVLARCAGPRRQSTPWTWEGAFFSPLLHRSLSCSGFVRTQALWHKHPHWGMAMGCTSVASRVQLTDSRRENRAASIWRPQLMGWFLSPLDTVNGLSDGGLQEGTGPSKLQATRAGKPRSTCYMLHFHSPVRGDQAEVVAIQPGVHVPLRSPTCHSGASTSIRLPNTKSRSIGKKKACLVGTVKALSLGVLAATILPTAWEPLAPTADIPWLGAGAAGTRKCGHTHPPRFVPGTQRAWQHILFSLNRLTNQLSTTT